jgi:hypothetical protein
LPYLVFPDLARSLTVRLATDHLMVGVPEPVLVVGAKRGSLVKVSIPHIVRLRCTASPLGQCEVTIDIGKIGHYVVRVTSRSKKVSESVTVSGTRPSAVATRSSFGRT